MVISDVQSFILLTAYLSNDKMNLISNNTIIVNVVMRLIKLFKAGAARLND